MEDGILGHFQTAGAEISFETNSDPFKMTN